MSNTEKFQGLKMAVTGGTGFLGSHFLPLAQAEGVSLACLIRSRQNSLPENVIAISGDCLDYESIIKLLRGQDIFVHMAGSLFASGWQDYFRVNMEAIRNIIQALQSLPEKERPQKIIFISSLAAAGPSSSFPGKNENERPEPVSAYGWSKLCCEQAIMAAPVKNIIILRPPIIYGSGDRGMLPLFKGIAKGIGVSPGAFRKFPVSVIHGKDMARAILLSCLLEESGIYHTDGNSPCNMDDFCKTAAKAMGKKCMVLHPPLWIMKISACLSSLFGKMSVSVAKACKLKKPKPPHWNYDKYLEAKEKGWLSDGRKFVEATGFKPEYNLESGLLETVRGYQNRSWL